MASLPEIHRGRAVLAVLVVVHLVLISRQVDAGGGHSLLQHAVFAVFHPIQIAVAGTTHAVRNAWTGYVDLRDARGRNTELEQLVARLEVELQERRAAAEESTHLRELLELRQRVPLRGVAAQVVDRAGLPWYGTLILDEGSAAGVVLDAPVIGPGGVVGRVIEVSANACKVQVLIDHQSGVGVLVERSRVAGAVSGQIARGRGDPSLRVEFVSARADIVVGDRLVTSGLDRIFPKGLLVGQVSLVQPGSGLFREVFATPAIDFVTVENVLILPRTAEPELRAEEPR